MMTFDVPELMIIGLTLVVIWLFAYDWVVETRKRRAAAPESANVQEPVLCAEERVAPMA